MGEFTVVVVTRTCLRAWSIGAHSVTYQRRRLGKDTRPTGRNATSR
jgi:hypothetical protein